ncbi:TonB-dependent receptor [Membranihabitans maritimus]|uniref:TonB-dependent receptor n=1 Tax=Membranihabitans maritimus TaxID=2904244 RepID=UPI001F2B1014|nr:TonB-dependent receptor [Membranihabitans maritimus]
MKVVIWTIFWIAPCLLHAQLRTFSIMDAEGGRPLSQAYVQNFSEKTATTADNQGAAAILASSGDSIKVSYVGYEDTLVVIAGDQMKYVVKLHTRSMDEVVILAEDEFHQQAALGKQQVSMDFLTAIPSLTGDADIMKTLTFLPGVTDGREGFSHLFVRGGNQDQNLILYDGATLFNVNHFGGFISMFHSDMIDNVDFYKSYWPSRYGGRLSSVLDIRSAPGNYKNHHQSVDVGVIYSKVKATGPIWKDKVSYSIGGRRTFIDLVTGPLIRRTRRGDREGEVANFAIGDANARVDARIGEDQHLSLSYFYGTDRLDTYSNVTESASDQRYSIKNQLAALNYTWYANPQTTWRVHASTSFYKHVFDDNIVDNWEIYGGSGYSETNIIRRNSGNNIRSLKLDVHGNSKLGRKWDVQYGAEFEQLDYDLFLDRSHQFRYGDQVSTVDSFSGSAQRSDAQTLALYSDGMYQINERWKVKAGLRLPYYLYADYDDFLLEPKALIMYDLTSRSTMNFSYNLQRQYTTLLGFTELDGFFREFYTTSDKEVPPSISHQWSMGYFVNPDYRWLDNFSAELFYKKQEGLVRFIPSTDEDLNVLEYENFLHRDGGNTTYGAEVLLQKTVGRIHASVAYTYAHSRIRFPTLNRGEKFSADFDFRHNASILLMYMWGKGYKLSAGWNYRTGRPFTLPSSFSPGNDLAGGYQVVNDINNYRMPAFHRLDLNLDREYVTKRGNKQWFGISIYNAYNQINPFYVSIDDDEHLEVHGFFPIIPSVHFGFEL